MTLDDALKVSNQDIAIYLYAVSCRCRHCSVMGREALEVV